MARQEQDREDLLQEATALVERAELAIPGHVEQVVIGFRRSGCASIFFGPDEAFHFNSRYQLRRAYLDGRLIKAEDGQLIALERNRIAGEVQLVRHELTTDEADSVLSRLAAKTAKLQESLSRSAFQLVGQVPSHADVPARMLSWLSRLGATTHIADSPHAR